tara:strand:- start:452 stop:610 length:159 start_codon:yes stop_codon:yes gene_type:complete
MKQGDLVQINWPFSESEYGIFIKVISKIRGRCLIFWDGDIGEIAGYQLEVVS